ncbi:hypothetical protein BDZ97DRAFT_552390 [Flammula alnicola]|nr:hypothetical protein BDZ97DRAFT_552390 [Flammula alnicola]
MFVLFSPVSDTALERLSRHLSRIGSLLCETVRSPVEETLLSLGAFRMLHQFKVSFGNGCFERLDQRGFITLGRVPFELGPDRDGRRACINRKMGLVLKTFQDPMKFVQERRIYEMLNRRAVDYVPSFYGAFRNWWMIADALLISFVGEPIDGLLDCLDWQHLRIVVDRLHEAGIHHHDLKFDNIVRGADGVLRVIDFSNSVLSLDCTGDCSDEIWLCHGASLVPFFFLLAHLICFRL